MTNAIALIVAAVVAQILGMLWYGPVFGKQWLGFMGWSKADADKRMKEGKKNMIIAFVGSLVTAYVFSMILGQLGTVGFSAGAVVGFWVWLGFLATTQMGSVLWEGKPKGLYYLNTLFSLVNLALMGGILAAWA
jgi:hypothetical protein|tara:strand:- start:543 stop:944 length:402 start_codon:yes stop_codon:yes gene_type:complete